MQKDLNGHIKYKNMLKSITEFEGRERKYLEKIRQLEQINIKLMQENRQQLLLMQDHPSAQIQQLIKTLRQEIRSLTDLQQRNSKDKTVAELIHQKDQLLRTISLQNEALQQKNIRLMELQYENNYLNEKINELQQQNKDSSEFDILLRRLKSAQSEKQKYRIQVEKSKKKQKQSEQQFCELKKQIQNKFVCFQQQILLYENQKEQYLEKIENLREELSLRQSKHYFSFSKQNKFFEKYCQTQQQKIEKIVWSPNRKFNSCL